MSDEKKRGRPKKRPETLAQWLKSDIVPNFDEVKAFLDDNQEKEKLELQRLSNNHEMSQQTMLESYNIPLGVATEPTEKTRQISMLEEAIRNGDEQARKRLRQIEKGVEEFEKLLEKQAKSKESLEKPFRERRSKIIYIQERQMAKRQLLINKNLDEAKATYPYVKGLETRIEKLEKDRVLMKNLNINVAKIEYAHSKVSVLEQELFKLKNALRVAGVLVVDNQ